MSVTRHYSISGMTCQNCVRHVTRALSALPGVTGVNVNLEKGSATVESSSPLPFDQVRTAVAEAGYEASEGSDPAALRPAGTLAEPASSGEPSSSTRPLQRASFRVEGMHCATCVFTIEKALRKEQGVGRASVNLATESCDLTFDPEKTTLHRIFSAVREAGYTPLLPDAEAVRNEYRRERSGLLLTTVLAAALLFLHGRAGNGWILALSFLLQGAGGWTFYRGAFAGLKQKTANMDTLVALGTTAALLDTVFHAFGLVPDDMVMTQALLLVFIRTGKVLEAWVKARARNLLTQTVSLLPEEAILVLPDNTNRSIPLFELTDRSTVLVPRGERIPADGTLLDPEAWVDLSLVTGESLPVHKTVGEELIGGATNAGSPFRLRVTGTGKDTVLFRILSMVQEAQTDRPPIQRLADRVSAIFVPAVIALAILSFLIFRLTTGDFRLALMALIGVLVVACPCALGLATPTAILVGTARTLRMGILFRKGQAIETLSRIDLLALDKTGTLTEGTFSDIHWTSSPSLSADPEKTLWGRVLSAVLQSSHPVSQAIGTYLSEWGISPLGQATVEEFPGKGLIARWSGSEGATLHIGNLAFFREEGIDGCESLSGISVPGIRVGVAKGGVLSGMFSLSDKLRPEAAQVLGYFSLQGVEIHLLTGDREDEARRIAVQAGILPDRVHAGLSPDEKRDQIRRWENEGRTVAMVGDGINDAGALAQASVGIAVASATALTRENGDVLLLGNHLIRLADAHRAATRTIAKVRQNLGWAFLYNVLGIPLAGGVLYPFFHLFVPPYYSGLAMSLSSVTVVANALSLAFTIRETPLPLAHPDKTPPGEQSSPERT